MLRSPAFLVAAFALLWTAAEGNALARGWGNNIEWYKLNDGLNLAEDEDKPMMLIFHAPWCGKAPPSLLSAFVWFHAFNRRLQGAEAGVCRVKGGGGIEFSLCDGECGGCRGA